jgi:hypothetical protein
MLCKYTSSECINEKMSQDETAVMVRENASLTDGRTERG